MPEKRTQTRMFRFDQMAVQVKDKIDNPAEADVDRYVGLEHIDPGSLKIRRWGKTTDVESSKIIFKAGDIIFGKRRAYQRKLAVADFDGICSAHAMVLRPKTDVVLREFLPFFMQSDIFMDRAVKISVGGLSPTINWRDLAKEAFALPSLEEQRRIAEVLQATELDINALRKVTDRSRTLREAALKHFFPVSQPLWQVDQQTVLEKIVDTIIDYRGRTPTKTESGIPLITAKNVRVGYVDIEPREFIAEDQFDAWMTRGLPAVGDILFTTEAPLANIAMAPDYKFAMAQRVLLLRAAPAHVLSRFLYWMLQGPWMRRQIFSRATGSTAKGIKQSSLRQIPVLLPRLDTQKAISEALDAIGQSLDAAVERIETARAIRSALMRGIFS